MAMQVKYEWTLEVLDWNGSGDIVDSDFSESLEWTKSDLEGCHLGLVRNEGSENAGVTDRMWAYVEDGKLPEYFSNADGQPTGRKVPQRFHKELASYL